MLLKPGEENHEYWFMFNGIDKILHLSIFAFLGFSYKAAFPKSSFSIFIYIMLIYAFLTEILQEEMKLGRTMEFLDIIADVFGVLLSPMFAAAAMSFSSVSVIANSLRLNNVKLKI
jgi:cation transport ATPase